MRKFRNPKISLRKFRNPKISLRKFRNPKSVLQKICKPAFSCEIRCEIWKACANSFCKPTLLCKNIGKFEGGCKLSSQLKNPFRNLANSNGFYVKCQRLVGKPKVAWINLFKDLLLPNLPLFISHAPFPIARSPAPHCELVSFPFHTPLRPWIWRSDLHLHLHFSPYFGHGAHQRRPYQPFSILWGQAKSLISSRFISGPLGPDRSVFWGWGAL